MNVALYARYSSDNQRTESIDAQIRHLKDFCNENNYTIVKIYSDEALSGTNDNRPQFMQMINDSKLKLFKAVVVHKLDRFARNRYDSAFYKRELKKHGVNVLSALEKFDDSPESIILESVIEGMNEYYSANLSREVMKGMKETAYECKHTGGKPPFGYDIDKNKKYIINDFEASIVRKIFKMYIDGEGYSKILKSLNGIKTKHGNSFSKTGINSILKNEKYSGVYVFNKFKRVKVDGKSRNVPNDEKNIIKIDNGVPSIITKEDFERAKKIMEANRKTFRNYPKKVNYLLSGLVRCGKCQSNMSGITKKAGRNKTVYSTYECSCRRRKKECDSKPISKDKLEQIVINTIETKITSNIDDLTEKVYNYLQNKIRETNTSLETYKKELITVEKQISNIVEAIANGMFHDSMKQKMTDLEKRKANLTTLIAESSNSQPLVTKPVIKMYLEQNKSIKDKTYEEQKKIIHSFVEQITVFENSVDVDLIVTLFDGGEGN